MKENKRMTEKKRKSMALLIIAIYLSKGIVYIQEKLPIIKIKAKSNKILSLNIFRNRIQREGN